MMRCNDNLAAREAGSVTSDELHDLFASADVQQPEDTIGFLLWRVAHRHQREVDRVLASLGLTHLQFVVLVQTAWLSRAGATVSQAGLARYGKVHPMQLSNVLKTLAAKGLVGRARCPMARGKDVTLTAAGIELLAAALPRTKALQATFFGDDPAFGADLHARLRQVVAGWGDDG